MANFWQIKKKDYWWTALELKQRIPELKFVSTEDIADHLRGSGIGVVQEKSIAKPYWLRWTLPFGLIFFAVLFFTMPIKFMLTGTWGYQWVWLSNWFKGLGF